MTATYEGIDLKKVREEIDEILEEGNPEVFRIKLQSAS
jgi:hypothetical protein